MGFMNEILSAIGGASGDQVHDYAHASRIYVSNAFRLHPKFSFLFYVRFNLNQDFTLFDNLKNSEVGSLAKSVTLPKFTIDTRNLNAYNRPNLVQTKIKYDPVTIKFHDDGADLIRELWYEYYSFYFRDSDHAAATYATPHKYLPRATDGWGYTLRDVPGTGSSVNYAPVTQLINNIQIFSFNQKRFSEVMIHNPVITSFRHGDHDYAQGTGLLENEMQLQYEAVSYASGYVTESNFGSDMLLYYDRSPSSVAPFDLSIGSAGTDYTYDENGNLGKADGTVSYYRYGQVTNGVGMGTGGSVGSGGYGQPGGAGAEPGTNSNSVFNKAATALVGGVVQDVIRGRNPLSKFSAGNIPNLLYSAGTAVGGSTGQKIIAAGGLIKAGKTISKGGIGPGNLGTVAVALKSASILTGIRPQDLLSKLPGK